VHQVPSVRPELLGPGREVLVASHAGDPLGQQAKVRRPVRQAIMGDVMARNMTNGPT